ncbi:hypothetical protein ACFPAF_19500 [Hymenobacter endophyticus]|uniref:Uncharacterized protein n=1 Tax=Hymenobacter endophyticus TaxID=3076335 RepID=A0ABU3TMJ9_9BACT|nr:hypothetical protein [Hymenobacter endophyticus]MDU0372596.1 hypothetical protein [Hymenobacter endophyticus]
MKTQYSHAKREQYGRLLAALLCDQYFGARPTATLDGPAVLRFTPIRQVNLFVVQQLLHKWTAEMGQLRSPYFDFEDTDVRQALTQFMNVLSRRIKISRPAFEPLLAEAITDTLTGCLDPTETFARKLLGDAPGYTPEKLRESLRYLDANKPVFEEFLATLPADQEQERDYLLSRFRLHREASQEHMQPVALVVEQFNVLLPLTEAELYETAQPEEAATATATASPTQEPAAPAPAPVEAPPLAPAEPAPVAPLAIPTPTPARPEPVPTVEQPAAPPQPTPATSRITATKAVAETATVPLYEKLKAEQPVAPSLSETLRQERAATLADKAPKVESLREAISINQRFSFINELFNGENMEYHAAIQHMDTLPSAELAKRYVTEDLASKYQWVRKDEHVGKLLKLIERKFNG